MRYNIFKPKQLGVQLLKNIDLNILSKYIDWKFFFTTWKLIGNYDGIERVCGCVSCRTAWLSRFAVADRAKAEQALALLNDAQTMLTTMISEKKISIHAAVGIFPASSNGDDIQIKKGSGTLCFPMLRQQVSGDGTHFLSLADFIGPENDYIGCFANTVAGMDAICKQYEQKGDNYNALLAQTIADRLAEATTEWLHEQVRKNYWGFAGDEQLSIEDMKKGKYQGIRPAVGYPSLPDQSIIFDLRKLLPFDTLGITVTENGAMNPASSVCGFIFQHPQARYFIITDISKEQFDNYALRRGISAKKLRPFIGASIC